MVIKRSPAKPVVSDADKVRAAAARAAEQGVQAPGGTQGANVGTTTSVPESASATVPSIGVDRDAAVADLGEAMGVDPAGSGPGTGTGGSAAGSVPGASSFIASATQGLSGSKLANLTGRSGPGEVDLQAEMDQNPAARPKPGQVTRDQLRERATSELIFQDPAQHQSIAQQGSGAVSDGSNGGSLSDRIREWAWNTAKGVSDRGAGSSVTNPQATFDDEGLHMKGTGQWANEQNPAFHAVAGLIASNLQRGQEEIAAASGKGAGSGAAPAGPVVEMRNGNLHAIHPDGSTSTTFTDGTEVTKLTDGTVVIRRADGSSTTRSPDGTITDTDAQGNAQTTTPGKSQPNEFQPVHMELIGTGALDQQLAAKRLAGSGDVTPTDDHDDLDFGAGEPPDLQQRLLGGDRRVDDISGTGVRGGLPNLANTNLGAIDYGPDAVTGDGSGPEQDRIGGTLLGDRPTLGIDDARQDDSDEDDADDTDDAD